ncbi:MAG: hypothetical protein DRJ50_10775 [Actinobacteria bacterium]|nr:MAG: hypothetical protein DRJ50_10775 [Actinomycetota bacterium]
MMALAGSVYLLATAIFSIGATIIGLKLILLSRRTGLLPERLLGFGLMLTAGVGYGVMMIGIVGTRAAGPMEPWSIWEQLTLVGWIAHNAGVVCLLCFVVTVFRPDSTWAKPLIGVSSAVLWGGWLHYVLTGGLVGVPHGGYWVAFSVIGTYPIWTAFECFRYHGLMKRRLALGLADPHVTNRFYLWGVASIFAAASIWIVNIPTFVGVAPEQPGGAELSAVTMLGTAFCGLATVSLYWLTFFPPTWYRKRIEARVSS